MAKDYPRHQSKHPDFRNRVKKYVERNRFMHFVGMDMRVLDAGYCEVWLKMEDQHRQQKGLAHGGVVATLADVVAGFAAYTLLPEGEHVVTAELKISYLNPGKGSELVAVGYVLKPGRKIHFCEAEVYAVSGENRTLIAKATTSMAVIQEPDKNVQEANG